MKRGILFALPLIGGMLIQPAMALPLPAPSPSITSDDTLAAVAPDMGHEPTAEFDQDRDYPSENVGLILWCLSAVADGDYPGAQKACGAAIDFNPDNPAPYKLRGASYLFQERYELARIDFTEAARLDPADPESHAGAAVALREEGKYGQSMAQFSVAIQLAPDDSRIWNARCWAHGAFARGLAEGLADCNRALRLLPGNSDYLDSRGLVFLRMGHLDDAIRNFERALQKEPALPTALYGRGVARLRAGAWVAAQADILQARRIDPAVDDIFVWNPLIRQRCSRSVARDQTWKCRPPRAPVQNSSLPGKTAAQPSSAS